MAENNISPNPIESQKKLSPKTFGIVFAILALTVFLVVTIYATVKISLRLFCRDCLTESSILDNPFEKLMKKGTFSVEKFSSVDEFKQYLSSATSTGMGISGNVSLSRSTMMENSVAPNVGSALFSDQKVDRTSTTNVQVEGIDEPDIVKVDDKSIFTSFPIYNYREMPVPTSRIIGEEGITNDRFVPQYNKQETNIISAFPPSELKKIGGIDKVGNLLLSENTLLIFVDDTVYAYDVTNRESPKELWNIPYVDNTTYKDARLYNKDLYLITQTNINQSSPCPYIPLRSNGNEITIPCTDIYHPVVPVSTDSTYTVFKLDPKSGDIKDKLSFVAASNNSILYMSEDNMFISYSYSEDYVKIFSQFIEEKATDLFSPEVNQKIKNLSSYDISNEAKMMEMQLIIQKYLTGLSNDEQMKMQNEMTNRMETFAKDHSRDFETTGIVKIGIKTLDINATGKVPGHPLNQFSLDEYKNNLRIATNSGSTNMFGTQGDINDVYVLNSRMDAIGSVQGLGKDERVYSARFIGDRGYVVTFRETDPFYVLDLSNPSDPKLKGELKIPGFSSYLHPVSENLILGVGRENSNVKLSLFDVSNPTDPTEKAKYTMSEYWTDVSSTHHAFLMDTKHKVFFIPGGNGGYIFSYAKNDLELVKTVSAVGVKRAVYINDYMYIIGEEGIIVLDEKNWSEVKDYRF